MAAVFMPLYDALRTVFKRHGAAFVCSIPPARLMGALLTLTLFYVSAYTNEKRRRRRRCTPHRFCDAGV